MVIKGIIIDVDGVIVGDKEGLNFPNPSKPVMDKLMKLKDNGIKICLCTGKPSFGVTE